MHKPLPALPYVREQITYDPATGLFAWASKRKGRFHKEGGIGSKHCAGYVTICLDKRNYLAHRLAWYLHHGIDPDGVIDHRDGDPKNNRIDNLRLGAQGFNLQNQRRPRSDNNAGYLGVAKHKAGFTAQIFKDGKKKHIGLFKDAAQAHQAYLVEKRRVHAFCEI